jgi:hypothetical protein
MSFKDSRGGGKSKVADKHNSLKKLRVRHKITTKMDCTATMQIRCIMVYKDYFVDHTKFTSKTSLKEEKAKTLKKIQDILEKDPTHSFSMERRYYVKIPLSAAHSGHPVGAECTTTGHRVDERVKNKIHDLVKCNVKNVAEIKRCLDVYVEDNLFAGAPDSEKPKKGNRRYYPRKKDIRNHIAKASNSFRDSTDNQESLQTTIAEWQDESDLELGNFFMTSNSLMSEEIKFLKENLNNFCDCEKYCFGYLNGEDKQVEDVLDNLQLITSTCYVRSESHSKEKGHKRLSLAGMELYI